MKKVLAVVLAILTMIMIMPFSAFAADVAAEEYCKIKRINSAPVSYHRNDDIEFYAEYYAAPDKDVELVWTIEGPGKFYDTETEKTTKGENVKMKFIDDATVRLQLVSSDGEVIAEDEMFLERYGGSASIFDYLTADVLFIFMLVANFFAGIFAPIL